MLGRKSSSSSRTLHRPPRARTKWRTISAAPSTPSSSPRFLAAAGLPQTCADVPSTRVRSEAAGSSSTPSSIWRKRPASSSFQARSVGSVNEKCGAISKCTSSLFPSSLGRSSNISSRLFSSSTADSNPRLPPVYQLIYLNPEEKDYDELCDPLKYFIVMKLAWVLPSLYGGKALTTDYFRVLVRSLI